MIGLFRPGTSPVHRLPAGLKLLALVAAGIGSVFVRTPVVVGVVLVGIAVLYAAAGFGPRILLGQVRPLLWIVVVLGVFQWLVAGWQRAIVVVGVIVALVLVAALVTLTTRSTALIDVVVRVARPLRLIGLDPERVGLALSLGIRSVPVIVGLAGQIREAQLARGLGSSPQAFAVPLVVRSLRHADALAEALAARGLDD
ncbi:MAG: cobalt transporter [Nocardioidaceae bacterium]|nr:cobalt transporter [Nocardioidaceae bacterium]